MKWTTVVYLILNFVGIILFGWFVYRIEALAHAEGRNYRDAVDGVTFFTTAVPVFLVCAVGSCVWILKVLFDIVKKRGAESLKALVAVVSAWVVAIAGIRVIMLMVGS